MPKFNDIHQYGEPFSYIHPYKQKEVKHLVDHITAPITHAIVFGSGTNYTCWWGSDLDVCLIGVDASYNTKPLRYPGQAYDFIFYNSLQELAQNTTPNSVEKEIWEKGVVVYGGNRKSAKAC